MAYQIFRVAKVKRQGVGGCQQEHNRTEKDRGRFPDSQIDYDKTNENIYLRKSDNYWEDIKKALQEHGIEKWRKDAVVMNDAIFTFSPEAMNQLSEEERMQYFEDCANWYQKNFGTVINAVVHKDETTWHMHIDSVPLVQKEDGTWKLSAKDQYGNKNHMAKLQTDLYEQVSTWYGLERGESRTGEEQRKHKTALEHSVETVKSQVIEQRNEYIELMRKTKETEEKYKALKFSLGSLIKNTEHQIRDLMENFQRMTEKQKEDKLKQIQNLMTRAKTEINEAQEEYEL